MQSPVAVGRLVGEDGVVVSSRRGLAKVFFARDGTEQTFRAEDLESVTPPRGVQGQAVSREAMGREEAASYLQGAQFAAALKEDYVLAQSCKESLGRLRSEAQHARLLLCTPLQCSVFERQLVTNTAARRHLAPELTHPPTDMVCATQIHAVWKGLLAEAAEQYPNAPHTAEALAVLRMYRRLCKCPHRVVLSPQLTERAVAGAALLGSQTDLKKTPDRPEGWHAEGYEKALQGTNGGLAFRALEGDASLSMAVHAFMNDSGAKSGCELAHRRWLLCPGLTETGFGSSGATHVVYTYASTQSCHDMPNFVAFPPQGCCPVEWIDEDIVWSCHLNPLRYALSESVSVTICPLVRRGAGWDRMAALRLHDLHIARESHGVGQCVAFRPAGLLLTDGACYEVTVAGLLRLPVEATDCAGLVVEEDVTPTGETRLVARNTFASTKCILKYTFAGTDKVPPRVQPLSPAVVALPDVHQYRLAIGPGEALPFVQGIWFSYDKVHATGPPDVAPVGSVAATVQYACAFFSSGLPGTGVDTHDIQ